MPKDLRIIFMGTPDFAVPTLQTLIENNYPVVAVITAPDKPAGRGLKLTQSPVKEYAVAQGIPVLQPEKLKNPEFLEELRSYQANLQIIVAFRMLPEVVWNMPELGTFNIHGSLLPQYRGAAPINWAIINGETETGVTSFFLRHQIDTGDIIMQDKVAITEKDDFGTMYERLKYMGANLALKTVKAIAADAVTSQPQPLAGELKEAPKIFKETCEISWENSAVQICNLIRGLSPYPTAWTSLEGKTLKIYKADIAATNPVAAAPGTFHSDGKTYLHVSTAEGTLSLLDIQLEGKKRMSVEEFLRGYRFVK